MPDGSGDGRQRRPRSLPAVERIVSHTEGKATVYAVILADAIDVALGARLLRQVLGYETDLGLAFPPQRNEVVIACPGGDTDLAILKWIHQTFEVAVPSATLRSHLYDTPPEIEVTALSLSAEELWDIAGAMLGLAGVANAMVADDERIIAELTPDAAETTGFIEKLFATPVIATRINVVVAPH